ncbi:amphi-Trp domain-containing protein [Pseudonocardia parietis]|uniref:Amphi-Trp domain-containing protein n=1 Tax=Pseudonocardia parietis TaxID=570936 RepID=A0ABS4VXE3_9PSEU|nr:amphi-Trp domain-containing protein [Pseudonocardia parietis]MBP2368586.1 amphi-Trp domain-containing protein [Pseudonocardia parietis]
MPDVEVSRTETLSRQEAARRLAALAAALADSGRAEVALGASTLVLHVPDQVRCEVEVEVEGDEVELEIELTWSTAPAPAQSPVEIPAADPAPAEHAPSKQAHRARASR